MTPLRIRLSRKRGYRMPPGTRKVDRSTKFGNPFPVDVYGRASAIDRFKRWLTGNMSTLEMSQSSRSGPQELSLVTVRQIVKAKIGDLRGKHLACWCRLCPAHKDGKPLDVTCTECEPCHADVLLELANR